MDMKKLIKEIFSWTNAILLGLGLAILVSSFVLQPFKVEGSSMEPTLEGADSNSEQKKGDRLLVYKLDGEPSYNDIVIIDKRVDRERTIKDQVLESPILKELFNDKGEYLWVKRVIGVEGDKLEFKDGKVIRNGKMLEEDYIKEAMEYPFESVVVEDNHVFVMGDNRNASRDSRSVGSIPIDNVVGKVFLRIYPFDKIGTLK